MQMLFPSLICFLWLQVGARREKDKNNYNSSWLKYSSLFQILEQEEQSLTCTASCNGADLDSLEETNCDRNFVMFCSFGTVEYNGYIRSICHGNFMRQNVQVLDSIKEAVVTCQGFWHSSMKSDIAKNAYSKTFLVEEFMCTGNLTMFKSGGTMQQQILTGRVAVYVCDGAQGTTYAINDHPNIQQKIISRNLWYNYNNGNIQCNNTNINNLSQQIKIVNDISNNNQDVKYQVTARDLQYNNSISSKSCYQIKNNNNDQRVQRNMQAIKNTENTQQQQELLNNRQQYNENIKRNYYQIINSDDMKQQVNDIVRNDDQKCKIETIISSSFQANNGVKRNQYPQKCEQQILKSADTKDFLFQTNLLNNSRIISNNQDQQSQNHNIDENFIQLVQNLDIREQEIFKLFYESKTNNDLSQLYEKFFEKFNYLLVSKQSQQNEQLKSTKSRKLQGITGNLGVYLKYLEIENFYESLANYSCNALCNNMSTSEDYIKCRSIYNITCTSKIPAVSINLSCDGFYQGDLQNQACEGQYNYRSNNQVYSIVDSCDTAFGGKYSRLGGNNLAIEEICQGTSYLYVQNLDKFYNSF